MNEEVGFIAALLAEPNDRTTMSVYADWLDDRGDPRAEYLRACAAGALSEPRLIELRERLDNGWITLLRLPRFGPGCRMRHRFGEFGSDTYQTVALTAQRSDATLRVTIDCRLRDSAFVCWELEVLSRSAEDA